MGNRSTVGCADTRILLVVGAAALLPVPCAGAEAEGVPPVETASLAGATPDEKIMITRSIRPAMVASGTGSNLLAFNDVAVEKGANSGAATLSVDGGDSPHQGPVSFGRQVRSVPWELTGLVAGLTAFRVKNLKNSPGFHFGSEGWFGKKSGSRGVDKLTHAFTGYVIADFLTSRIRHHNEGITNAQFTAGVLAVGLTAYAEMYDGFAVDHGFSHEDLISNVVGAGFSVLRNSIPGMKDKIDFRMQYIPSNNIDGFHPLIDYSGQKHLLALQLAGFEGLKRSPLRFVELHTGYFARGITAQERARGERVRRKLFFGIGLNVQQLLFPNPDTPVERMGRSLLDYVQVPYTAAHF